MQRLFAIPTSKWKCSNGKAAIAQIIPNTKIRTEEAEIETQSTGPPPKKKKKEEAISTNPMDKLRLKRDLRRTMSTKEAGRRTGEWQGCLQRSTLATRLKRME